MSEKHLAARNAEYDRFAQNIRPAVRIIGLAGLMGAGKSTVGKYLRDTYRMDVYAFATPLKKIAEAFGFEHHELYGSQAQKEAINPIWQVSARRFMQTMGTEVFRQAVPQIMPELANPWIRIMENKLTKASKELIVIDDVRFADEAALIRKLGGRIIRVERSHLALNHPLSTPEELEAWAAAFMSTTQPARQPAGLHASELGDFTACFTVSNNGTHDELYRQISIIMDTLGHPPRERRITKAAF